MTDGIGRLADIMAEPGREPFRVHWEGPVEGLGTELPSDYRAFVERYGHASFHGDLSVVTPDLDPGTPDEKSYERFRRFNEDVGEMLEGWYEWNPELGRPYPPFPAKGGLLAWASNTSADYFCWDTSAGDPDQWPVVVWRFGISEFVRFDGGMTAFLTAVLTGEVPDSDGYIDRTLGPDLWRVATS
ncbi:SMI1/KNR4 family protein [Kitasatospora sp. NPDC005856]|uniref:SMI1/KNR4 family protein n=1 Tax=Kitasatospora sp. NPDC005856 TaxID=3154566 RepID=UPI003404866B